MTFKRFAKGLFGLVCVLIVMIGVLVGTPIGLRATVGIAERAVSGLEIASATGTLLEATIKDVRYTTPSLSAGVASIAWRIEPADLFTGTVRLSSLTVGTAKLDMQSQSPETPATRTQTHASLEGVSLQALCDTERLRVDHLVVRRPVFTTVTEGPEPAPEPLATLPERVQSILKTIELPALPLTIEVARVELVDASLAGTALTQVLWTDLALTDTRWELGRLTASDAQRRTVRVEAGLTPKDAVPLDAKAEATFALQGQEQTVTAQVSGALRDTLHLSARLAGGANAKLRAQVQTMAPSVPISLALTETRATLDGHRLNDASVFVHGTLADYRLEAKVSAETAAVKGPVALAVNAAGTLESLRIADLTVKHREATLGVAGDVAWTNARPQWDLTVAMSDVNAARWGAGVQTQLTANATLSGTLAEQGLEARVTDGLIQGDVNGAPTRVAIPKALWQTDRLEIPTIDASVGPSNRLRGAVRYERGTWHVEQDVHAEALEQVHPDLKGHVVAGVRVAGALDALDATWTLSGKNVTWKTDSIVSIESSGTLVRGAREDSQATLTVAHATVQGRTVNSASLQWTGTLAEHRLLVDAEALPLHALLRAKGGWSETDKRWTGSLDRVTVQTPRGELALDRSTAVTVSASPAVTLAPHCWTHPDARVCAADPMRWTTDAVSMAYVLERVNVALANAWMPSAWRLDGEIAGDVRVVQSTATAKTLQAEAMLTGRVLAARRDARDDQTYAIEGIVATVTADERHVKANVTLTPAGSEALQVAMQVDDVLGKGIVNGTVRLPEMALAPIGVLLADSEKIDGRLGAELRVSGTLKEPYLHGTVRGDSLGLRSPNTPVVMKDSTVAVAFDGRTSRLDADLRTTRGYLTAKGEAEWPVSGPQRASVRIVGDRFLVRYGTVLQAAVSPDLTVALDGTQLDLTGTVTVPAARISVAELPPDTVTVSSDERLVDVNWQPIAAPSSAWNVRTDVNVVLGERVRFNAFGLKSKLTGSLSAKQSERGLSLHGQVELKDGTYKAYGQDLQIRKGRLMFAGLPQEPVLDIEAVRNPDSTADGVISGLRVTGSGSTPNVQVFSIPTMGESQALSYLLTGQGPGAGGSDGSMVTSALVGLGAAKSGRLIGQLGNAFGIRRLGIDTEGAGQDAKVVVSGYILPDVQLKYGVGLFDSLATWTLRYEIVPQLFLEAMTGTEQALDVLYRFEF